MSGPPLSAGPGINVGEVPQRERMRSPRRPDPLALVIFGATGDLTRRKLMPALFRLFQAGLLPDAVAVVGFAREPLDDQAFRERMRVAVERFVGAPPPDAWDRFAERLHYVGGNFQEPEGFQALADRLSELDEQHGTAGNRLFYLAIPPGAIQTVVGQLHAARLGRSPADEGWVRLIVEKPFGRDLDSARELNRTLLECFDERQIFRIDHYLGKETVQNLLVFRFANVIWEPVWNRNYIDHVQITVAETVGVEQRAGYYDRAGALRDMVQSHLLQLLTLVAMEPPSSYDPDSIRTEKVKLLRALVLPEGERADRDAVRGQYRSGVVGAEKVAGYRDEPGVAHDSGTETFAALRLSVENWRWAGVPFFLRTGKRLPRKVTEVAVQFRPAPHPILDTVEGDRPAPNRLVLRIQPEEGISLSFEAKVPGLEGPLQPVSMDFAYSTAFSSTSPEAYERLLLDAMLGDATLFTRCDEVEAAWAVVQPVLDAWQKGAPHPYAAGSWGPEAAHALLSDRQWRQP